MLTIKCADCCMHPRAQSLFGYLSFRGSQLTVDRGLADILWHPSEEPWLHVGTTAKASTKGMVGATGCQVWRKGLPRRVKQLSMA